VKTLLIDDHVLFRQGMKFLLTDLDSRIEFIEADSCKVALEQYAGDDIEVILLDFHIPGEVGTEALAKIKQVFASSAIVIVSSEDDPHIIRGAIEGGAAGFIPKSSTQEVLIAALRLVMAGGIYLPSRALHNIGSSLSSPPAEYEKPARNPIEHLSSRQREVLISAVKGRVNKVIARELDISESTVKAHLSSAFRALGVSNRTEAVFVAAKLGLGTDEIKPT
jgi:DNA-binding NarL/FixJ family response regulator